MGDIVTGLIDAASAILLSAERKIEAASSNISNSSTNGYKRIAIASEMASPNRQEFDDFPDARQSVDTAQGQLTITENPLDIAIHGPGYFQLRDGERMVFSRGRSFQLADGGRLVDAEGRVMQQTNGGGDLVSSGGALEVLDDGTVLEDGLPIGQLGLWEADQASAVRAIGGTLFAIDEAALVEPAHSQVRQGFVESSNVLLSDEMVAMMAAIRQAEGGGRIVQVYDQLMGQAVQTFSRSGR